MITIKVGVIHLKIDSSKNEVSFQKCTLFLQRKYYILLIILTGLS
ncbi:hypothetical protein BH24ACI1_BH24ACI1_05470 [soil metagenome]